MIVSAKSIYLSAFAGVCMSGASLFGDDSGAATSAILNKPRGVSVCSTGIVYIADTYNNCIRIVNTSGIIFTVTGGGAGGVFSSDGGAVTSVSPDNLSGVFVETNGNIFIYS